MDPTVSNPPIQSLPTTEDATPVSIPTPQPSPTPPAPQPVPTPIIPEVKSRPKWGTGALVGAIGAVLVLVIGLAVGTGLVSNLQEKLNPEKKAGATCQTGECEAGGVCFPNGTVDGATNTDSGCVYSCSNGAWTNPHNCPGGGGGNNSPEGNLGCGGSGQYPCTQYGAGGQCGGKCDGSLVCPSSSGNDKCGTATTSDSGGSGNNGTPELIAASNIPHACYGCYYNRSTCNVDQCRAALVNLHNAVCPNNGIDPNIAVDSQTIRDFINNCYSQPVVGSSITVVPNGCVAYRFNCPGMTIETATNGCNAGQDTTFSAGQTVSFGSSCGIQQIDFSCNGSTIAHRSQYTPCGSTTITPPPLECGAECAGNTLPNSGCATDLTCSPTNGVCFASRCASNPTPTPTPISGSACQRIDILRDNQVISKDQIKVGDVITFRGFATAQNTNISSMRFTINQGGTPQTYTGTNIQKIVDLWQADSPPITIAATSYTVSVTPVY